VSKRVQSAKYYLLFALLVVGIVLVYRPGGIAVEADVLDLSSFPMTLGEWVAEDRTLPEDVLRSLGASDYLLREYRNGDRNLTLYVTYFDTGHGGLTHNPEKCYTASGWVFLDKKTVAVPGTNQRVLQSTIVRGENRQVVLYWYQARTGIITSKWRHVTGVLSKALTGSRTHSLVASISAAADDDGEIQLAHIDMDFARQVMDALAEQVPL